MAHLRPRMSQKLIPLPPLPARSSTPKATPNSDYALLFSFPLGISAAVVYLAETLACVLFRCFVHTSSLNLGQSVAPLQAWKGINIQWPTFDSVIMSRSSAAQSENGKKGAQGAAKAKRDKRAAELLAGTYKVGQAQIP